MQEWIIGLEAKRAYGYSGRWLEADVIRAVKLFKAIRVVVANSAN